MTERAKESLEITFPLEVCHSETDDLHWIEDANGCTVCDLYMKISEGKFYRFHNAGPLAAFIVTACNSHHDLVEACEALAHWDECWPSAALEGALRKARDALAKAKGGAS